MYLINTELTVNWYLLTGANPPALADLDIRTIPPSGDATYQDNAISVDDYIPSTATTKGLVTYRFTPTLNGLWTISLSNGTSAANVDYYAHKIVVSTNDTLTKKFVRSSLL